MLPPPFLLLVILFSPVALHVVYLSSSNSPQVRKYKSMILEDLESALLEHAPAPQEVNSELPPLTIDGIPVSVDKMTQVSNSSKRWKLRGKNSKRLTDFSSRDSFFLCFFMHLSLAPQKGLV